MSRKSNALSFSPLTPDRWADFEKLFGPRGACAGCWCMYWRGTRKEYEESKGDVNKARMKSLVESGVVSGLLAYCDGEVIGWCAVAPREDYDGLARSRIFKPTDDTPVWSVSCLFIHKSHRNKGVSVELLKAACQFVSERGGTVVEGYPVEPKTSTVPDAFAWNGIASAYLKAGFHEHRRGSETRPVMRCEIGSGSRRKTSKK